MERKDKLTTGEIYHVFNRSIAEFKIFNHEADVSRIVDLIRYYQIKRQSLSFSNFNKSKYQEEKPGKEEYLVQIIAYCVMPTHFHLILKQVDENGISIFIGNILNAYSKYFNIKSNRKGPLWEGRFKNVLVDSDDQLLHLTRYVHLNPVTAGLVDGPQCWRASSYKEYILDTSIDDQICSYKDVLDINPMEYKNFVNNRIEYQRNLAAIKNLILEER